MALRIYYIINNAITRNLTRILSTSAAKLAQIPNVDEKTVFNPREREQGTVNKYSISSNQRTSPVENPYLQAKCFEPERQILQRNLQNKYLQPATLPDYADQPIFDNKFLASLQEQQIEKAQAITTHNSASQKIFENFKKEQSKNPTKKMAKLLSNPFPDPIKAAHSPYIYSDEEKAQQMLDDQKTVQMMQSKPIETKKCTTSSQQSDGVRSSKKFFSTTSFENSKEPPKSPCKILENLKRFYGSNHLLKSSVLNTVTFSKEFHSLCERNNRDTIKQFLNFNGTTSKLLPIDMDRRTFASKGIEKDEVCIDKRKCHHEDPCIPRKCEKLKLKGCPPPSTNTMCKKKNLEVKCKKVEAPYPSFSESCYVEPDPRDCECRVCPWSRKGNPNFKKDLQIPPKSYHTDCRCLSAPTQKNLNYDYTSSRSYEPYLPTWMQKANLTKRYHTPDKEDHMVFFELNQTPRLQFDCSNKDENCDRVGKDTEKCDKKQSIPCKGAKLPRPVDYLKSYIQRRKGKKNDPTCRSTSSDIRYSNKDSTLLTEYFLKNENLKANFRNGDDLALYGINKGKLSRLLSSSQLSDNKNSNRQAPDYPRNCEKEPEDKSKMCPSGLTKKKTLKDRLRKKKSQMPQNNCN